MAYDHLVVDASPNHGQRLRVTDSTAYDAALCQRISLAVRFTKEAITAALTLQTVFGLGSHQIKGLIG